MITVEELFKNCAILNCTISAWGNSRKADKSKISTDSDKSRLKITKDLIKSDKYDEILSFQRKVRCWLKNRTVPSFFKDGFMLVKNTSVADISQYLEKQRIKQDALVEELAKEYNQCKAEAKIALNGMYRESDYPDEGKLKELFSIDFNFFGIIPAESLEDEIKRKEAAKLKNLWEDSIQEIIRSLRFGFKELVDHAVDRLTVLPGEKPKTFKESFIPNFQLFIDTFSARNIVNDSELEVLVNRAKEIVNGLNSDTLRSDMALRDYTAAKFSDLKKDIDAAVVSVSRKFDFSRKAA